jgi:hypothetical protein
MWQRCSAVKGGLRNAPGISGSYTAVGAEVTFRGIASLRAGGADFIDRQGLGVCLPISRRCGARFDFARIGEGYGASAHHHYSFSGWMRL